MAIVDKIVILKQILSVILKICDFVLDSSHSEEVIDA